MTTDWDEAVPPVLAAQLVAASRRCRPRVHSTCAEIYEELSVEEQERAAERRARRARMKTGVPSQNAGSTSTVARVSAAHVSGNGHADERHLGNGHDDRPNRARSTAPVKRSAPGRSECAGHQDELHRRVRAAVENGEPVTGETVGRWLGLYRLLQQAVDTDPHPLDELIGH